MKALIKKIIPQFFLSWYHFFLAFLGAVFYGFPSREIKVIGITGTNGKSTTVELTKKILEEAGFKVASVSSIKFQIGEKEWRNEMRMTMPGRFFLQRFLRRAVNSGCQYAVLEVTSEGIVQHRHRFIDFNVAVFTNLAPEHIESHGSFEKYRKAKGRLFETTKKVHVINLNDENSNYFLQFPADKKYGYKIDRGPTSITTTASSKGLFIVHCSLFASRVNGISFDVQDTHFDLNLLGRFNAYNSLAAICVALSRGIDLKTCKAALEKIERMPGRMEVVIEEPFKVIVDYAFTPNALREVYKTIKRNFALRKMICVFGACGGGRDKWKRPELGKIAAEYCHEIILTNEDPFDEPPMEILKQIASGIKTCNLKPKTCNLILDRREAIRKALSLARTGDMVVITGKGSEPSICVAGGRKIPWDDRQVVREEFQKL